MKIYWIVDNLEIFRGLRGLHCLPESLFRGTFNLKLYDPKISFFKLSPTTLSFNLANELAIEIGEKTRHPLLQYKATLYLTNDANNINQKFDFDVFCTVTHESTTNGINNIFLWEDNWKKYYLRVYSLESHINVDNSILDDYLLSKHSGSNSYLVDHIPFSVICEFFGIDAIKNLYSEEIKEMTNTIPITELEKIYKSQSKYMINKREEIEINIYNSLVDSFIQRTKQLIYIKDENEKIVRQLNSFENHNLFHKKVSKYLTNIKIV